MATAIIESGVGTWLSKGLHKTTWDNLDISTTGDVGSVQSAYGGLSLLSVYVTGSMASDVVLAFQQCNLATGTYDTCKTACGIAATWDTATGGNLELDTTYTIRSGGAFYRPKITAGASAAENISVVFIQSKP